MSLSKKQRIAVVAVAAVVLWVTMFGGIGYFAGVRGIGTGWPAFWAVGGIGLFIVVAIAVIVTFIWAAHVWVERAKK